MLKYLCCNYYLITLLDLIGRESIVVTPSTTIDGVNAGALLVDVFAEAEPKLPQQNNEVITQDNSDKYVAVILVYTSLL